MILITNVLFFGIKIKSKEPNKGINNIKVIKLFKNNINFNVKITDFSDEKLKCKLEERIEELLKEHRADLINIHYVNMSLHKEFCI